MEAIEKKFRDFVITPSMAVAPITRTTPVTGDILSADAVTWDSNLLHIRIVISEMSAKHKLCTDDLSDDLEIISLDPKQVCGATLFNLIKKSFVRIIKNCEL